MSTSGIEDTVKSTLTCVGVEQKSYECLLDYDVEGYIFLHISCFFVLFFKIFWRT